ncbi:MAG TPA: VIT family protein [Steroidobacteraceae bacterium]|jgi:VIT1/CCC1 family predicted Fe2+/Mn2+ transporter
MRHHRERHRSDRSGWLRAAVLGANDGILSTASLLVGIAAAHGSRNQLWVAGLAGLVAGAMSMAAGEYVSVSSQADTENADLERERKELAADIEGERTELANIYVSRGVEPPLARQVAEQLMHRDALGAHARDELGLTSTLQAQPVQAALASAASFAVGACLPLITALLAPQPTVSVFIAITSLILLVLLGASAASAGGASPWKGAARVSFWGALAMAVTATLGSLLGAAI